MEGVRGRGGGQEEHTNNDNRINDNSKDARVGFTKTKQHTYPQVWTRSHIGVVPSAKENENTG